MELHSETSKRNVLIVRRGQDHLEKEQFLTALENYRKSLIFEYMAGEKEVL